MDLRQISYFIAVAEELSFRRAAQRLHLTQPPLSQAVRTLEESLGVELFIRSTRGVSLTLAGAAVLAEAYKLLAQAEALKKVARRAQDLPEPPIRLACIASALLEVVPCILNGLRELHPAIEVRTRECSTAEALSALSRGDVDLAIARVDTLAAPLTHRVLRQDRCVAAVALEHPLARCSVVQLADLARHDLALFARELSARFSDAILAHFIRNGHVPKVVHESTSIGSLLGYVARGWAVSILPASAIPDVHPGIVFIELQEKIALADLALAWNEHRVSGPSRIFINIAATRCPTTSAHA